MELTAITVAAGSAFLLRERGLTLAAEAGEPVRFDPLLGAVPVLIGLAVGLVAMRLYPLPVRALGWLAARRRDLVPVLGLRTVGRHPTIVALPLLVLMLTAAIGAFSSVVVATVDRGQQKASWREFGADYVIEPQAGLALAEPVDPTGVDGVAAVARAYRDPVARLDVSGTEARSILLYAVEPAAYRRVTAGSPIQPAWPDAFDEAPDTRGLGTGGNPLPAIVSRRMPVGLRPLAIGATFQAAVQNQPITFEVVGLRTEFPGVAAGAAFVIAPFDQLALAPLRNPLRPTHLLVSGPASIEDGLRTAVRGQSVTARVASRHARYAEMHDAPLAAAIATGFRISLGVAAAYTALTIVAAVALTAGRRSRDLAYLRTLGFNGRQALGLIIVEHAPPVAFALAAGVALGLGVAWMIEPGLGLASFIGPDASVDLQVDWLQIGLVGAGLVAVVSVAVLASTWLARRVEIGHVLRLAEG
jgi:putative ABC transport system permease protein